MDVDQPYSFPWIGAGPIPRSRVVDSEVVDEEAAPAPDGDGSRFCPSCHGVYPTDTLSCPDDASPLVTLPPAIA